MILLRCFVKSRECGVRNSCRVMSCLPLLCPNLMAVAFVGDSTLRRLMAVS